MSSRRHCAGVGVDTGTGIGIGVVGRRRRHPDETKVRAQPRPHPRPRRHRPTARGIERLPPAAFLRIHHRRENFHLGEHVVEGILVRGA
ncbi:hypothetical protein CSAL01_13257, partial [Colletotrichum salicis]